jgi:hypothetical protein
MTSLTDEEREAIAQEAQKLMDDVSKMLMGHNYEAVGQALCYVVAIWIGNLPDPDMRAKKLATFIQSLTIAVPEVVRQIDEQREPREQ